MSSKMSDLCEYGWHIYWDVNEPTLTISGPGYYDKDYEDSDDGGYRETELVLTKDQAKHLLKSIAKMLEYWDKK